MPTIRDVAEAAGVSPMTVSFVLNNKPGQVGEATRQRVLQAVRDLEYRPRAAHRVPLQRKMQSLGIVSGVAGNTLQKPGYYQDIISAVFRRADELSLNVTLFASSLFKSDPHVSIRTYCDGRCDGLLVVTPNIGNPLVAALEERGVPCVIIGTSDPDTALSCVDMDNVAESRRLTEYLVEQGHKRIAFVGGPEFVLSVRQRESGFRAALLSHGVQVRDELILKGVIYPEEIHAQITRWMKQAPAKRPTAIFCWDDGAAAATMHTLQRLRIKIPDEVSVVGWNDDPSAAVADPPLTTLRQPYQELGQCAVDELLHQIRKLSSPRQQLFKGELIVRHSVAPPRNKILPQEN